MTVARLTTIPGGYLGTRAYCAMSRFRPSEAPLALVTSAFANRLHERNCRIGSLLDSGVSRRQVGPT